MKQPPTFSTGDPSYFVVASTSGSASPTVLTISNASAGLCPIRLRFIEAGFRLRSPRSDIGQRQGARSLAIDVCEAVLHCKASGHQHGSGVPHDVGIPGKRRDGTSDELGGF